MTYIDLHQNAETALRMVRESKDLAYDTETSGLDWKRNVPIGYVFTTDPKNSLYVPIRHGGGGNLQDPSGKVQPLAAAIPEKWDRHPFEIELAKAFKERERTIGFAGRVIGHHMQFDCHSSATAGIYLGRAITCTQNTQTLINEYTKGYSLENLGKIYSVTAKKGEELYTHLGQLFGVPGVRGAMEHYWRTSGTDPIAYDYAIGDGVTTLEVYQKQLVQIGKQDLQTIFEVENNLIWTLFRLERRGIPVDMVYIDKLLKYIEEQLADARSHLPTDFNPRSPTQMRALMEANGHTDWPMTAPTDRFPKGNPSFTAKWLKGHEIGRKVVGLREWTNLVNSFILPLRDTHSFQSADGVHRVHASLKQNASDDGGTVSGRLACGSPNLQAVPKHNKALAAKLRRAFVAENGMSLCEADLSQCEPRLFAHYSKDKNLVDGYNAVPPKDVHTVVAELMGVDRGTTGKRMNMGIFTGMQVNTFADHMELPRAEAAEMWNRWYELFPGVRKFQNTAKNVQRDRGYVKTLLGRRGRLESPRFAYKATSRIIQGNNADIIKDKLVRIDIELEKTEEAWLIMSIHDSVLWMTPKGERGDAINQWIVAEMVDVQTPPYNLIVPFAADFDSGDNWAEASYGHENAAKLGIPV